MVNYVYTSKPCTGRMIQTPAYAQREIDEKQTTGDLKNLHLVGVPLEKQLAYDAYIMNLPAFMQATAMKKKVTIKNNYFKATVEPAKLLPFPMPPLCLQSRKTLKKDEDKANFIASLRKPVEHIRYNNMDQFIMRDYSISDFVSLPFNTINVNTPSPNDATSVLGVQGFLTCLKVLSLMLATHSYAAFNTPEQGRNNFEHDSGIYAQKGMYSDNNDAYRGPSGSTKTMSHEGYLADLKIGETEIPWSEELPEAEKNTYFASLKGVVSTAKPAPYHPSINFGDPKDVPSLPGYVLPYFRGVHDADPNVLISIFRRYFYTSFGDNSEDNTAGWRTWCQNVRRFAYTDAGMAMTHAFFCLQTALEAQARLYLHKTDAGYLGASILGYKFVIVREGEVLVPEIADACYVAAIRLDRHQGAVAEVVRILEDLELKETEMKEAIPEESKKAMRRLVAEARRRKPAEKEVLKTLCEQFDACRFDEPFWPLTIERIEQAARAIYAGTWSIEWPMLLYSEDLYSEDPVTNVLSAFGPMAPSLIDSAGIPFEIPKGLEADDKLSVVDESGKRPLDKIYVTGKKLNVAITDWRHMTKKRSIRQSLHERARGYRTIEFTGNGRNMLWKTLREMPFVESAAESKDKGKKRSRDEDDMDDDDTPAGKRRGRVDTTTYDALNF